MLHRVLLLSISLLPLQASAETFYMVSNLSRELYEVEDTTGALNPVLDLDLDTRAWTGIADRPGEPTSLYATSAGPAARLSRIDLVLDQVVDLPTIQAPEVGFNTINGIFGLAIDPSQPDLGTTFARGRIRGLGEVGGIVRIDLDTGRPIGPAQLVSGGPSNLVFTNGLDYDRRTGELYAALRSTGRDVIGTIDPATGAIDARPFSHFSLLGLGFRPDGRLIVTEGSNDQISELDPATGRKLETLAMTAFPGPLTYLRSVPEPTTAVMIAAGLLVTLVGGARNAPLTRH